MVELLSHATWTRKSLLVRLYCQTGTGAQQAHGFCVLYRIDALRTPGWNRSNWSYRVEPGENPLRIEQGAEQLRSLRARLLTFLERRRRDILPLNPKTKRNGCGSRGVLGPPEPKRDHREARALQ
jgi:hypothetical protein